MLPSSGYTITIRPSKDYLKIVYLLYAITFAVIWQSQAMIITNLLITTLVMLYLYKTSPHDNPVKKLNKIYLNNGSWLLLNKDGSMKRYERLFVSFNGGLFVVLSLVRENSTNRLIIFNDQIDKQNLQMLRLLDGSV